MRLKIIAQITNNEEPKNTREKIKFKFVIEITSKRATAPEEG